MRGLANNDNDDVAISLSGASTLSAPAATSTASTKPFLPPIIGSPAVSEAYKGNVGIAAADYSYTYFLLRPIPTVYTYFARAFNFRFSITKCVQYARWSKFGETTWSLL